MVSLRTLITTGVVVMATPATAIIGHLIRPLTYKTVLLFAPAQSIDLLNGPLIAFGQGPFPVSTLLIAVTSSFYLPRYARH